MANHSSAVLTHQVYPTVPKVQPDSEDFETEPSSRAYEGPTDQPLQADAAYSNQLIASDSYNLLTGAELLEAPLTESHRSQGAPDAEGGHSASPLLGRLYSNPSAASSGSFRSQSSAAPKSNSWESISGAAPYNNSFQNMLMSGASMLAASTSTATAQLLIGGLQGGSFDGGHHSDPSGGIYYPSPNHQQEAMQLYYVNAGFSHGFSPDGRSGVVTTLMYPPQDGGTSAQQASCAQSQDQYGVAFLPATLAHTALNQQALESISPAGRIPLSLQELSESNGNQSYGNWRHGGNEHSFLPTNEASQSTPSQFGTDLPQYGVARASHDLSHMHQTDHLQGDVAHGLHLDHSHGSPINGQGLALSLSSHQPQSAGLHFHSPGGQLPEADHMNAVAVLSQAAAIAKTKEAVSRYFTEANAGLSRFRTPSREEGLGTRFQLDQVDVGGRKHVESSVSVRSSNHFSASRFLRSAQEILNEVCRVSSLKRPPKPARSSEQHWNMAAGPSSTSIDGNLTYHAKEDRGAMLTEVDSARDPASFADTSQLITVSHVSHASEMNQSLGDTARTENRDGLELKKGKLGVMLDEVEARYRRYCDQLQLVMAGFNSQAGSNAATPYTILALQAMSRHFRCLRDAIGSQQKVVKRALGEDDRTGRGETSRLRYVDQQMRQQRALQQLGMLQQHAWRPQRGLPERAVSVLRAWLFEHFLHPYPKDVDKLSLAKQTGLTRSQVSNWFINARVRLWKPMVEEMYLEEQREAEEAAASERMARDQADTGKNSYREYERGRGHSGLLNEVTENGLSSTKPKDMMKDSEDREHDAGPNAKEGQGELCPNSLKLLAGEHQLEVGGAGTYNQEGREAKKARNFTSDTFNSRPSMLPPGLGGEGENRAKSQEYSTDGEDICNGDLNRDEEMYSLSQKGAANVDQLESAVGGAFGTYERNNLQKYSLEAHSGSASRASATIIPTTSNGVSLTLGLRHSEANLRSSMESSILSKYNVNMDDQTNVHLLNRVDQFDGQIDDPSNNCGQSTAGFSNGHYLHISQDHSSNFNQQLSPGCKRPASQTRHHELVANLSRE